MPKKVRTFVNNLRVGRWGGLRWGCVPGGGGPGRNLGSGGIMDEHGQGAGGDVGGAPGGGRLKEGKEEGTTDVFPPISRQT